MPPGGEDRARSFYAEILGIAEKPKPAHLRSRGGVWFEQGAVRIHLGVEPGFKPARKAHPRLQVRDLRALAASLRAHRHEVVEDDPLEGAARIYTDDPFGNRIELIEYVAG